MVDRWSLGLAGAVLAAGAAVLFALRDEGTMDPWYLVLLVVGTAGASFAVGWVLGYLTDNALAPGSEGRE